MTTDFRGDTVDPVVFKGKTVESVEDQLTQHLCGLVDAGEGVSHLVLLVSIDADGCRGSVHARGTLLNSIGEASGFNAEADLAPRLGYAPFIVGSPTTGEWRVEWGGPFTNAPGGVA